jgi:hypothetical protein
LALFELMCDWRVAIANRIIRRFLVRHVDLLFPDHCFPFVGEFFGAAPLLQASCSSCLSAGRADCPCSAATPTLRKMAWIIGILTVAHHHGL